MTKRFTQRTTFSNEQTKVQLIEAINKLKVVKINDSVSSERLIRIRSCINELSTLYTNIYREMLREEIRISNLSIKAESISERKNLVNTTYQKITSKLN